MELAAVRVDVQSKTPVVLLQEASGGRRTLPIFIGGQEANAIAYALQGVSTPRPLTHDLLKDVIEAMGANLERVVVTELVASTYFAELHIVLSGKQVKVSSRPSDAIALAARTGSPIFVSDDLLESEGVLLENEEEPNPEEIVGEFQRFLDTVRPEDFGPQ